MRCIIAQRTRAHRGVIYGIIRATARERAAGGSRKVTVFRMVEK